MSQRDNEFRIRPGRIRDSGHGLSRPKSFVGQVMRAAKKAGHVGHSFGRGKGGASRSRFGRGRRAALSLSQRSTSRRVVMKARVVRHQGTRFRSAPLAKHITYLKRDGVTRDGAEARMFDVSSDAADERAFAERCRDDRHHFRFIISPEDAAELGDLRAFTRELMTDVSRDLGTKLDWIAVDHWNTDNPHVHVLIRGRSEDGQDLVISRDYISRGFRDRAAERVTLELGPRSEQEIRSALEREVEVERWTSLDRALRVAADEGAGVADLRPSASGEDPELRRLMLGRAARLERLGLAEQIAPGCWTLKPGIEDKLRDLAIRGDIIKTMHRAMSGFHREPDVSGFALHGDEPVDTVLGRLVERGLQDELKGSAYAIVEGVDGRTHHIRFIDIEMTGDATPGAIVEARTHEDAQGRKHLTLATRSDLSIEAQVTAQGATWIDRQLIGRGSEISSAGFGIAARDAMERRIDHLAGEGLARRQGQRVIFARDLLDTLRQRELDAATARLSAETGLPHRPCSEGEHVAGIYRRRLVLASGRFAMIDDGVGLQLVPWRPALERHLGREVSGVAIGGERVTWSFERKIGLGI
ncbi:relaxase/mobilization nuclease domain-containing protein [Bradyrhizobium paxllaeri]|uniref:relaxase/mobilization nuclease domain-containing protein n=1 Tax=Bradyrhizobium paxllaeri TaxID=190148 RepID=UPI000810F07B|nr:VirD2 family relaxase/mobilization nuclease [Bradyrhizobium paxllaeri]